MQFHASLHETCQTLHVYLKFHLLIFTCVFNFFILYILVAQLIEHQKVLGSIPSWTKFFLESVSLFIVSINIQLSYSDYYLEFIASEASCTGSADVPTAVALCMGPVRRNWSCQSTSKEVLTKHV